MRSVPVRPSLVADCASCFGLCCVALPFATSADFPSDKPAGHPCLHLERDFSCGIHSQLRPAGFRGCTVYDCFGAGQRVSQETFAGQDWRMHPHLAAEMFAVFPVVRGLHEVLWYLEEALGLPVAGPLQEQLRQLRSRVEDLATAGPAELGRLDVARLRGEVGPVLAQASELSRRSTVHHPRVLRDADLAGAALAGADLRCADLRGACLIGADLTHADLRGADLLGADLRDAQLAGADLAGALFLTPMQVRAAQGDPTTRLPQGVGHPSHWAPPPTRPA